MTFEELQTRIRRIQSEHDPAIIHNLTDWLWYDFINDLSENKITDPVKFAKEIITPTINTSGSQLWIV